LLLNKFILTKTINKMKKITLKISAILLLSSVLFFACKKEKPEPVVDPCTTLATTLSVEIAAAQAAYVTYLTSPTPANCTALKSIATSLSTKVSACPAIAAQADVQVLITGAASLDCTP
jgi:hypothetical protein